MLPHQVAPLSSSPSPTIPLVPQPDANHSSDVDPRPQSQLQPSHRFVFPTSTTTPIIATVAPSSIITAASSSSPSSTVASRATLAALQQQRDALAEQLFAMESTTILTHSINSLLAYMQPATISNNGTRLRGTQFHNDPLCDDRWENDWVGGGARRHGTPVYLVLPAFGLLGTAAIGVVMYVALVIIFGLSKYIHDGNQHGEYLECEKMYDAAMMNVIIMSIGLTTPVWLKIFGSDGGQWIMLIGSSALGIAFFAVNVTSAVWLRSSSSHTYDDTGVTVHCRDTSNALWAINIAIIIPCFTAFALVVCGVLSLIFDCHYERRHPLLDDPHQHEAIKKEKQASKRIERALQDDWCYAPVTRIVEFQPHGQIKQNLAAAILVAAVNGELPDGYEIDWHSQPYDGRWLYTTRTAQDKRFGAIITPYQDAVGGGESKHGAAAPSAPSSSMRHIMVPLSSALPIITRIGNDVWRAIFQWLSPHTARHHMTRVCRAWSNIIIHDNALWNMYWHNVMGHDVAIPSSTKLTPAQLRVLVTAMSTGDGTVRLRSTLYPFLPYINVTTFKGRGSANTGVGYPQPSCWYKPLKMRVFGVEPMSTHDNGHDEYDLTLAHLLSCDTFMPSSSLSSSSNTLSFASLEGTLAALQEGSRYGGMDDTVLWHVCLNDKARLEYKGAANQIIGLDASITVHVPPSSSSSTAPPMLGAEIKRPIPPVIGGDSKTIHVTAVATNTHNHMMKPHGRTYTTNATHTNSSDDSLTIVSPTLATVTEMIATRLAMTRPGDDTVYQSCRPIGVSYFNGNQGTAEERHSAIMSLWHSEPFQHRLWSSVASAHSLQVPNVVGIRGLKAAQGYREHIRNDASGTYRYQP